MLPPPPPLPLSVTPPLLSRRPISKGSMRKSPLAPPPFFRTHCWSACSGGHRGVIAKPLSSTTPPSPQTAIFESLIKTLSTRLHYRMLHHITLHYTALRCATPRYTALRCATLCYPTLHHTVLHHTMLYYSMPHYTALRRRPPPAPRPPSPAPRLPTKS